MGIYGLPWTLAISFGVVRTPGVQIWVQGPFGAKFKNLPFCHKTPRYGCLWTRLGLSNFLGGDSDPGGPNLGPRAFWRQIQKSELFSQNPVIWVSVDSSGSQQSFGGDSDPRGPNLGPRAFWRQIQKSALFLQNPTIWVSMDSSGPLYSFLLF